MIIAQPPLDDGRGRYPDRIAAAAPRGFRDQMKRAAQAERITMGEFVRRAVSERIGRWQPDGDDGGPSTFPPAAVMRVAA